MALAPYDIDLVHSRLGFSVVHLMITRVHGEFTRWGGRVELDLDEPARSEVRIEIDAASVDTRNAQRDGHLRSPDFFDVDRHPQVVLVSRAIERAGDGFRLTGDLTLRGTTLPVTFAVTAAGPAKDSSGRGRLGYHAAATIRRKDFGVSWSAVYDGGSIVVAEEVDLALDLQLIPR